MTGLRAFAVKTDAVQHGPDDGNGDCHAPNERDHEAHHGVVRDDITHRVDTHWRVQAHHQMTAQAMK